MTTELEALRQKVAEAVALGEKAGIASLNLKSDAIPHDATIWHVTGSDEDQPVGEAHSGHLADLFAAAPGFIETMQALLARLEALEAPKWKPIDTAPLDNKRPLVMAMFNTDGSILEMDWNCSWEYWEESWELSHINGYTWFSDNDRVDEPTHWAYQDEPLPPLQLLEDNNDQN